jgi:S-methylmethionine-dependent homocysteine/selenocysteine methylase
MATKKTITILDGGMSRELMRLNAPFQQPEWSALALIESPHFVSQVHKDFIAAGADVITTNSYAVVPFHIGEERFWRDGERLAALAGKLAREAADEANAGVEGGKKVRVAGCLPPIFGSYEPNKFDEENVSKYLDVLVRALDPYVDFWLAETLSLLSEAKAALSAAQRTGKPFWVAFTPDDSFVTDQQIHYLRSNDSLQDAANWAFTEEVDALLFNCARPEYMAGVIDIANKVFVKSEHNEGKRPALGVYANAFEPRSNDYAANADVANTDDKLNVKIYFDFAAEWVDKGADIVGGCCGIGHDHIRELTRRFKP